MFSFPSSFLPNYIYIPATITLIGMFFYGIFVIPTCEKYRNQVCLPWEVIGQGRGVEVVSVYNDNNILVEGTFKNHKIKILPQAFRAVHQNDFIIKENPDLFQIKSHGEIVYEGSLIKKPWLLYLTGCECR